MKTDAQVSMSDNNLRELKLAKELIYLAISDFFKDEGPYTVENKETFVFFFTDLTINYSKFWSQSESVKNTIHLFCIN